MNGTPKIPMTLKRIIMIGMRRMVVMDAMAMPMTTTIYPIIGQILISYQILFII